MSASEGNAEIAKSLGVSGFMSTRPSEISHDPVGAIRGVYHRARIRDPLAIASCGPASPRAQAKSREPAAAKQPDGQITQTLSSPSRKNIPLNLSGKSVA